MAWVPGAYPCGTHLEGGFGLLLHGPLPVFCSEGWLPLLVWGWAMHPWGQTPLRGDEFAGALSQLHLGRRLPPKTACLAALGPFQPGVVERF